MSRFVRVAGIAVLVITVVLAAVGAVTAQTATPTPDKGSRISDLWERMHQAIAKALGITVEQYDTAVSTAQSDVLKQAVEEGLLTQEQADKMAERWAEGPGTMDWGMPGVRVGRGGLRGPAAMGVKGGSPLLTIVAEKLGISVAELTTELGSGKSIAEVATAKGVDLAVIVDAVVAEQAEQLNNLVADGRITQEKADSKLADLKLKVQKQLESTLSAGHDNRGGLMRGEPRGRFPGTPRSEDGDSDTSEGTSNSGSVPGITIRSSY
jgi:polyhydroxyalkanoate synthesis regulator phasin